ncbi:hypothetical protein U1Q18_027574, partial [Sarracenia purpurea var. burkii]
GSTESGSRQRNKKSAEDIPAPRTDNTSESGSRLNLGIAGKIASQKKIKSIIFKNDLMEGITGEIELNNDEEDRSKHESIKERESGLALHGDNFGSEEYEDWMGHVLQRDRPNEKMKGGEPTA